MKDSLSATKKLKKILYSKNVFVSMTTNRGWGKNDDSLVFYKNLLTKTCWHFQRKMAKRNKHISMPKK